MNSYGIDSASISDLSEIDSTLTKHYRWDGVDFLLKPKRRAKKLLVTFHGAGSLGKIPLPIFRGFDWDYEDVSMLCISDGLLEMYKEQLILTWFLSTAKHDFLTRYEKIIRQVKRTLDLSDVVFFGSSGGGFPSIVFSTIFECRCIISNSQLDLPKYFSHLKRLERALADDGDHPVGIKIEEFLLNRGFPRRVDFFQNMADEQHKVEHYLPFKAFCEAHNYKGLHCHEFEEYERNGRKDPHPIIFPKGTWLNTFLPV